MPGRRRCRGEYLFNMALACPEHYSLDELNPRDFSFNAPLVPAPTAWVWARVRKSTGARRSRQEPLARRGRDRVVQPLEQLLSADVRRRVRTRGRRRIHAVEGPAPKTRDALLHGLGDEKIRIDYVTRDGRDTYAGSRAGKACSPLSCASTTRATASARVRASRSSWRSTPAIPVTAAASSPRCSPSRSPTRTSSRPRSFRRAGARLLREHRDDEIQAIIGKPIIKESLHASQVPRRRRPRLPHARPAHGNALRRRSSASVWPQDRRRPHGRALHPRRPLSACTSAITSVSSRRCATCATSVTPSSSSA